MNNTPPGLRLVCGLLIDDLTRFLPCERLSCYFVEETLVEILEQLSVGLLSEIDNVVAYICTL